MCFDEKYFYPQLTMGIRAGVWLHYADNIRFAENIIRQMEAVGIGIYDGFTNSVVEGNVFCDLASSAITAGLPLHQMASLEEDGLSNISIRKPITASNFDPAGNGSNLPIRVNKGDYTNSKYINYADSKSWVQIDLQDKYSIGRICIPCDEEHNFAAGTRMNFQILASNDPNFGEYSILARQGENISNFPWKGKYVVDIKDPAKYRYVRVVKEGRAAFQQIIVLTPDLNGEKLEPPTQNCQIKNNYITRVSNLYKSTCPIEVYYVSGYEVSHNEIYDAPYTSIQFGWGWARGPADFAGNNKINYNRLENGMLEINDGGHIYLSGPQPNSEIVGNYVNGTFYGAGGIYPDNGSNGWNIRKNVVEKVNYSFHPWSPDQSNIAIEDNYVATPNYRIAGANSYVKDTEVYIRNRPPEHVSEIMENAGLEDEFKHIANYANRIKVTPWKGEYPIAKDYALMYYNKSSVGFLFDGPRTEANAIIKIVEKSKLAEGEYSQEFLEFKEKYDEIQAYMSGSETSFDGIAKAIFDLNLAIDEFTTCGIFDDGYNPLMISDGVVEDDTNIPVISKGTVTGDMFVNDFEAFKLPATATSKEDYEQGEVYMEKLGVKNLYYTAAKFGDVMFEFDFKYNFVKYDFAGFVLRGKDRNSYMEASTNGGYSFNFGDKCIDVQRFNDGKRTVLFGNAEGVAPTSGIKQLNLPMISYNELNHIKVGAFNVENGVRLYFEINGEKVFDFVDSTAGYLDQDGYFSLLAPYGSITIGKTNTETTKFKDLENMSWATPYIYLLNAKGVINGKAQELFAPNDSITRAEFAKLVCKSLSVEVKTDLESSFVDVESWYKGYVTALEGIGALNGIYSGKFEPDKAITRSEAITILYNTTKYKNVLPEQGFKEVEFGDSNTIEAFAKEGVEYFVGCDVINGMEDGKFYPQNTITRAEAAKIIFLATQFS